MTIHRISTLIGSFLLCWTGLAQAAPPKSLEPLGFLVGEWTATGGGQPGQASGRATFAPGLQDRIITRTSFAEYPATEKSPASRHDDLLVIYATPDGALRADYWDSEGHVIRYAVTVPAPGHAEFLSDPVKGEPRYRLSYTLRPEGVLHGEFAIASPAAPEAFKTYLAWDSRKTTSAH